MKKNELLFRTDPSVGSRVCLGCLPPPVFSTRGKSYTKGLKPWPHTFVDGICALKAPGVRRVPIKDPMIEREEREMGKTDRVPF